MFGNIGDIFLTSDRAVLFREDFDLLTRLRVDQENPSSTRFSGIVLSGSTGLVQFLPGIAGFIDNLEDGDPITQARILSDDE